MVNLLGFASCAGLLAYAILYLQERLGLEPCPLCIFQRIAFIALGLVFLVAAIHQPKRGGRYVYA
ncbi:MAG TPA: disulfide bond formation protein B, partial [Candidatus Competibacteraceae bacterium]|nr:disulfide bond formation protein B [Candidatus Competibacteraceae bacterium]